MSDSDEYIYSSSDNSDDNDVSLSDGSHHSFPNEIKNANAAENNNYSSSESKSDNNLSVDQSMTLQLAEMTGLSINAATDLLEIANGDVTRACAIHFEEPSTSPFQVHPLLTTSTTSTATKTATSATPYNFPDHSIHLVAEMTGLTPASARGLLESTAGDVETAVMLHFEGAEAVNGSSSSNIKMSKKNMLAGKRQRRRQNADDRLRATNGVSYDAFDAYKAPTKKPTRRQQKRGFANLESDSDSVQEDLSSSDSSVEDVIEADGSEKHTVVHVIHPPTPTVGKDGCTYFTIRHTNKTFRSLAQAENFMNSKKYKQLMLAGLRKERKKEQQQQQQQNNTRTRSLSPRSHASNIEQDDSDVVDGDDDDDDDDGSGGDDEWVTDEDEQDLWEPQLNDSLFDNHTSDSFESNALYMQREFSFFVPQLQRLRNPTGLFSYLQEKVCRYHICLYCNRIFDTVYACRQHMLDASHCKFALNRDLTAREFYDTLNTTETGNKISESGHLVLSDGTRVGHRDMKRYYRQNIHTKNSRVAVVANRRQNKLHGVTKMQHKMMLRAERKSTHGILTRSTLRFKGTSKAIASTYVYKPSAADNKHARAIVHHAGSHFHRAGTRQFHRGVRVKGIKMRGRHGSKLSSAMVRQRGVKKGNSSSNRGNRRFDHRRG